MNFFTIILLCTIVLLIVLFVKQRSKLITIEKEQHEIELKRNHDIETHEFLSSDIEKRIHEIEIEKRNLTLEKEKLAEKNKRMWTMSEAVYKEKKKVDEEIIKLNEEKLKLETSKNKLDEKVKKLWATSTAVHKEKERINILKQEIERKHQEILDSVTYAQRIQEAILPSRSDIDLYIPLNFVLFKPRDIVSGDFYWFAQKGEENILACVDCTGHGVPGAFMSMIGNTLLNQIVNERNIIHPNLILNELNKEITTSLKQDTEGSDSRDGMDISILKLNLNAHKLEFAGANRPLYFVRDGELIETKANKVAIGGHMQEEEKNFTNHEFQLHKGDTIYLSSDGFADQFSPADKKLMTKRFKEILLSIQHLSMAEQEQFLAQYIDEWRGSMEQTDDILVIGVRV
ncbi:MAG TPA: SpoIIE family protein phosphatase [Bacteroidia bacterium]|nr:SpoIIE family protein phosphatase [Bacteroidia bacterium]